MKGRELGCKLVRFAARVVLASPGGNGILVLVVEPGIKECPRAVHFGSANVSVPVGHGPEPGPGVKIHSSQAISRRNQSAGTLSVGSETLAVFIKFRVKTAGAPTAENLLHSGYVHSQQVGKGLKVGC